MHLKKETKFVSILEEMLFLSVEKKLKNKSHCLDDFVSQEVSDITRFLNLHENHLTRGKKSRFHIGEYRIV